MKKEKSRKNKSKILKAIAFSEMFVMVLASFAFAFIFSAGMVSGATNYRYDSSGTRYSYNTISKQFYSYKNGIYTLDTSMNEDKWVHSLLSTPPFGTNTESYSTPINLYEVDPDTGNVKITDRKSGIITYGTQNENFEGSVEEWINNRYGDYVAAPIKELDKNAVREIKKTIPGYSAPATLPAPATAQAAPGIESPADNTEDDWNFETDWSSIKYEAKTVDGRLGYFSTKETAEAYAGYNGIVTELGAVSPSAAVGESFGSEEYSFLGLKKFTMSGWGHLAGNLMEGVQWAGAVWGVIQLAQAMGVVPEDMAKPLGTSLFAGILAGKGVLGLIKSMGSAKSGVGLEYFGKGSFIGGNAGLISFGIGAVVAYLIFANQYKKEKEQTKTLNFKCMSWQAPSGGNSCAECNKDPMRPCSEYRCKALGQACELLNKGTGQEKCEWVNRNDAISPGIKPWNQVLTNGYVYAQVKPRPAGGGSATSGMWIERATENANGNKCIDPYTPIEFGILTYNQNNQPEPAQCKIEYTRTNSFSEMGYYFGDSNLYLTNHSQKLSMPSISSLRTINENESEGLPMEQTPGEYTFYVRCADANGNENRDEFAVRFCIDEGPDMTAPIIKGTNFGNQTTPVQFGQDNLSIDVYTNEPANCFWEREDRDYNYMGNQMSCSSNVLEMNAELLYTCHTTLTAIEDRTNNYFFFRCVDPSGNAMQEGYQFTVIGTQPLDIITFGPNGTIAGSTSTIQTTLHVETANGYNNGEAICFYSSTGENSSYIEFFYNTSEFTNIHNQVLDLNSGTYNYYFRCIDLGGNSAMNSTTFTLDMDRESPLIVRAYNENNQLLVITDESSDCRYNTQSCSFNFIDGLSMSNANSTVHEAEWKEQNYYIKCADGYNNQPDPTECSIVVRPYLG